MSVTVTPEIEDRIQAWIATWRHPDAGAVLRRALEVLDEQEQARFRKLRALVIAGRNSGSAGELTPEPMDEIAREAKEAAERGEQPGAHVRP